MNKPAIERRNRQRTYCAFIVCTIISLPFAAGKAQSALELAEAIDIPTNSIVSASFAYLSSVDAVGTATNWGTGAPRLGTNFAVISTGKVLDADSPGFVAPIPGTVFTNLGPNPAAGQTTLSPDYLCPSIVEAATGFDYTELRLVLKAPTNAYAFRILFNFFSSEYPESLCNGANDRFFMFLSSQMNNLNIAFDSLQKPISARTARFAITNASDLAGTGMETHGAATGWLTTQAPVYAGETITLRLVIFDAMDRTGDSLTLLDGFEWMLSENPPQLPVGPEVRIQKAVAVSWASVLDQMYQVQWASEANTNDWYNLSTPVSGNGGTNIIYDSLSANASRFYRVLLQP